MTDARVHGHTRSGKPITDTEVQALADEAEAGYDVDRLIARRSKRGRPALGSAPASVESVRLDPEPRSSEPRRYEAQTPAARFALACAASSSRSSSGSSSTPSASSIRRSASQTFLGSSGPCK